jgi:hypothetical protein
MGCSSGLTFATPEDPNTRKVFCVKFQREMPPG